MVAIETQQQLRAVRDLPFCYACGQYFKEDDQTDHDPPYVRSLVVPFPKGSKITRSVEPLRIQHVKFVETIKVNRLLRNVDRIECNRGQLVYECVWDRFDRRNQRCCIFALNVCD